MHAHLGKNRSTWVRLSYCYLYKTWENPIPENDNRVEILRTGGNGNVFETVFIDSANLRAMFDISFFGFFSVVFFAPIRSFFSLFVRCCFGSRPPSPTAPHNHRILLPLWDSVRVHDIAVRIRQEKISRKNIFAGVLQAVVFLLASRSLSELCLSG